MLLVLAVPLLADQQLTETHAAPAATPSSVETFAYDAENRLIQRWDGVNRITYTYDGQGNLVKKSSTDGTSTVYIGGIYEKRQDGSYITYYNGLGRRLAMRVHTGPGDPGTMHFFLGDHLGSTSTVLSAEGAVEETAKYYPFGAPLYDDISLTDKKFTGQQEEGTAFGLYYYGARFYSTTLGRFLSADPVITPGDPQMLDHYSYVRNNPLVFVDPTGLYARFVCGMGQDCEGGGISEFESWVRAYWEAKHGWSGAYADELWKTLNKAMAEGASPSALVFYFDVAFFDTEGVGGRAIWEGGDVIASVYALNDSTGQIARDVPWNALDLMVGFSFGGVVAHDYVWGIIHGKIDNPSGDFDLLLIQPAFDLNYLPGSSNWEMARDDRRWNDPRWVPFFDAPHPEMHADEWTGGTIVTINESSPVIGGEVWGAVNRTNPGGCGGAFLSHCTHQGWAKEIMYNLVNGCFEHGCMRAAP